MTSWKVEFESRAKEIESYFEFLAKLDAPARLEHRDANGAISHSLVSTDLVKTLKGAGFLLLYNLVESTMRNGIAAIFDVLKQRRVRFDQVRKELREVAIENLKKHGTSEMASSITDVASEILTSAFDGTKLFSGNVDAKRINKAARTYGFSAKTTTSGEKLLKVKTSRNDLSHGDKSFREVGRDHDVNELIAIKHQVISYLTDIVSNIDSYIARGEFLAAPLAGPATSVASPVADLLVRAAAAGDELPQPNSLPGESTVCVVSTVGASPVTSR